jgi:D-amino-acid dehydrogenase
VPSDPDVLVVGGGAVGLFCAYHLRGRGARVALVERGTIGGAQSSSSGNTGFLGTHGVSVLAEPGMLARGLRGLLDPAASVVVRPGLDRDLLRWLWFFWRACSGARHETGGRDGLAAMAELKQRSLVMLRELCAQDATFTEPGMVLAFKTEQAFERACGTVPGAVARGVPLRALSPAELRALEPGTEFDIHGALYNEEGAFLRVPEFITGLGRRLAAEGADLYPETEVTGFDVTGGTVDRVRTTRGDFRPGAVVIAAGAWSAACARLLDVKLTMAPVRGYSITVESPPGAPRRPVLLAEARAAVSPFGESVRFAGILEICALNHAGLNHAGLNHAGLNRAGSRRRFDGLRRIVGAYLPQLAAAKAIQTWSGLRPCTPDSLPFLGRAEPYLNLFVAAGHGSMGMGLAPASGLLIAQAVAGEQPDLNLKPFRLGRF